MPIKNAPNLTRCPDCNGQGAITTEPEGRRKQRITIRCERCGGDGRLPFPPADIDRGPIKP